MRVVLPLALSFTLLPGCAREKPPVMSHGKPVSYWLEALNDPDARKRVQAVKALGHVGTADPAALPALTAALKDRDPAVRARVVLALLNIGPAASEAIPALEEARNDSDPTVRSYVEKALERIRGG